MSDQGGVIGVVPAAGRARRLGEPDASKELARLYRPSGRPDDAPLPILYRLLDAFRDGGIDTAVVVTRGDKRDIVAEVETYAGRAPRLELVTLEDSPSAARTVAAGTRVAGDRAVALGFPDVLWEGEDGFARLIARLAAGDADVVLGLFPPPPGYAVEGVVCSAGGRVTGFLPRGATIDRTWTLATWTPRFSRLLERTIEGRAAGGGPARQELTLTHVLERGLSLGLGIEGIAVSDRAFLDIGAPERLEEATRRLEKPRRGRPGG